MLTEFVGVAAATLTTLSFVPQVAKTWQDRSAADFSWIWLVAFSAGLVLWLAYGLALVSWPLIVANGITLSLVLVIAFVKWREGA